jgi:hypothetical protein
VSQLYNWISRVVQRNLLYNLTVKKIVIGEQIVEIVSCHGTSRL